MYSIPVWFTDTLTVTASAESQASAFQGGQKLAQWFIENSSNATLRIL